MIASVKRLKSAGKSPAWHGVFLKMLPAIRRSASISFRQTRPELRHDLIEETVANAFVAFVRLIERGQEDRAFPSALARYAISQVRGGRRVANRLRISDVMSPYAQYKKGFSVATIDQYDEEEECWQQVLIEDKRATPADVAACRIDFAEWLRRLTARLRKIALALASGETTKGAAEQFGLSPARISQLRECLRKSWEAFQGETQLAEQPQLAAA